MGRAATCELIRDLTGLGQLVLVSGTAGVGKTAVLDLLFAESRAMGATTRRIQATEGVSAIPLGAMAHLLPAGHVPRVGDSADQVAQMAELAQLIDGHQLYVDDAPLLDPLSLHVIVNAVSEGRVGVVATARAEHRLPDALASLVANGRRVELTPLPERDTRTLVERLLGGPVDRVSAQRLHHATEGLPLAVTELVHHGLDHGRFVQRSGLYRWTETDRPDVRLADLLGARVDALAGAERTSVEVLCLAEHLPASALRAVAGGDVDLEALERQRWLRSSERPGWVRPGHPLLQEAVLAQLGGLRRHDLLSRLVEAITGADDELARRRLVLACEVDAEVDPAELASMVGWIRAHRQGGKLIGVLRRAWRDLPSLASGWALADALGSIGASREAAEVFAATEQFATTDVQRVDLVLDRAHVLRHGAGDVTASTDLLDLLRRELNDPALRARVAIAEAEDAFLLGRCHEVLEIWSDVGAAGADSADLRYRASQSVIPAMLYAGRVAQAEEAYSQYRSLVAECSARNPFVSLYVEQRRAGALTLAGRGAAVAAEQQAAYDDAVASGDPMSIALTALPVGMVRWLAGDLDAAERLAREAMHTPIDEVRQIASYLLARVLRLSGRHREILELCEEVIATGAPTTTINTTWVISARAMARAALSRRPDISGPEITIALDQAATAARLGQYVPSAYLLHDLITLGLAEQVAGPLAALASACDAPAVQLLASHARGLVEHDPALLGEAADAADALGLGMLAATMRADATRIAAPGSVASPLTAREREVALAAGAGMADKEIALHLGVSVRTVNAHLRSIYSKLDIGGRRDLVFLHESGERFG